MTEPGYGGNHAPPPQGNGMAVGSLVVGIVGLLLAMVPLVGLISWILTPIGLVLGFVGLKRPTGRGMAIGGLITSGLALLICILWAVGFGALIASGAATTAATTGY